VGQVRVGSPSVTTIQVNFPEPPFIAVNCGAIPESLLEAELFDTPKVLLPGANENPNGFFRTADKGTLF